MEENLDLSGLSIETGMFLLFALHTPRKEVLFSEDFAAPVTWRCRVIGEVPYELRNAFFRCFEVKDDLGRARKAGDVNAYNMWMTILSEALSYLFKRLKQHFPESGELRITTDWKVAEELPLWKAVQRLFSKAD